MWVGLPPIPSSASATGKPTSAASSRLGASGVRSVALAHRGHAAAWARSAGGLEVSVSLPGYAE